MVKYFNEKDKKYLLIFFYCFEITFTCVKLNKLGINLISRNLN